MLLLVLDTAVVKKESFNASFLIKYSEKYEGYSGGKWRKKQSRKQTNKNNDLSTHFASTSQWVNNMSESVGSEEKIICHKSVRVHVFILITWILTDTRKSKNIQKKIKFGWKIRNQHRLNNHDS